MKTFKNSSKIKQKQDLALIQEFIEKCEDSFDPIINIGFTFIFEDFLLLDSSELTTYRPSNSLLVKL